MIKHKKKRKLLIHIYPSGIVGKGKKQTKIVTSVLTPKQYENRFYRSSYHFNTEAAMETELFRKK